MTLPPHGVVFEIDPDHLEREEAVAGIRAATEVLARGDLVIVPTETVYGLVARPDLPDATAGIFEAKRRTRDLSLPVLAPNVSAAWRIGVPTAPARRLAARFWPGPLTLVLPRADRSRHWQLGEDAGSVAVRVPDHGLALALLERTGPLAATSANRSGGLPLAESRELVAAFGPDVAVFLLLAPGTRPPRGLASTVVDARGEEIHVLREGAIDAAHIPGVAALLGSSKGSPDDARDAMGRLHR